MQDVRRKKGKAKVGWSLQEIVEQEAGPGARIVAIHTRAERHEVPEPMRGDPYHGVIRVNQSGHWRLLWVDRDGYRHPDDRGLQHVQKIEVVPAR